MSRNKPPVEPFWPYGCVAYISLGLDGRLKCTQLPIVEAAKTADGWEVLVHKSREEDLLFELDDAGESTACVPWDEEMEASYLALFDRRLKEALENAEVIEDYVEYEDRPDEWFDEMRRRVEEEQAREEEERTHHVFPERTDDTHSWLPISSPSNDASEDASDDVFIYLPRLTGVADHV